MDEVVSDLKPESAFVWMDIQGHEGHALSRASGLKDTGIPMCIEFWPYGLKNSGGYELLVEALLEGKWNVFIDLENPAECHSLTKESIDNLFKRVGLKSSGTDILVQFKQCGETSGN